jgi:hypothetical protein
MKIVSSNVFLADLVRDSGVAGKKDAFGLVTAVIVRGGEFPATAMGLWLRWSAYIEDLPPQAPVRVVIRNVETGQEAVLFDATVIVNPVRKNGFIEIVNPLPPIGFVQAGTRVVEVSMDGKVVASTVLLVQTVEQQ